MKRVVVAVVIAAALVGAGAAIVASRDGDSGASSDPAARATAACRTMIEVQRAVRANEAFDRVRSMVDDAVEDSRVASQRDPVWVPLFSGILGVEHSLDNDDGAAARIGMDSVVAACERTRSPFPD